MQKFEYKVFQFASHLQCEVVEERLNEWGVMGWRVIGSSFSQTDRNFLLEREIRQEAEAQKPKPMTHQEMIDETLDRR